MLLYGAIFETQHMGIIVGEATASLTLAVTLGGVFEVPPQEIVSIKGDRFALTDGTVLRGHITTELSCCQGAPRPMKIEFTRQPWQSRRARGR
jgi:hypothetical protein